MEVNDGVAVAEFAAVIHLDRQACEPLNHEFPCKPGVPTGPASHNTHLLKRAKLLIRDLHLVEEHLSTVLRNTAEQSVANRARLLEDFLLHEMLIAALFRHDGV